MLKEKLVLPLLRTTSILCLLNIFLVIYEIFGNTVYYAGKSSVGMSNTLSALDLTTFTESMST